MTATVALRRQALCNPDRLPPSYAKPGRGGSSPRPGSPDSPNGLACRQIRTSLWRVLSDSTSPVCLVAPGSISMS